MKRSDIKTIPEYFDRYINEVEDIELNDALNKYGPEMFIKEKRNLELIGDKIYAAGKWTIKDILQHLIDTERIFCYRALRFARNDKTTLPGFDENYYAETASANERSVHEILKEYSSVRNSAVTLFNSFNKDALHNEGLCFDKNISVLAMGFVLAGHPIHHLNVIRERYYDL
ncbi:MAG: DinB family protein [Ignavibacteria bacterium]